MRCYNKKGYADGGPVEKKYSRKRKGTGPRDKDSTNAFGRDVSSLDSKERDPGIWKKVMRERTNAYRSAREELGIYPGHDGMDDDRVWNNVDDAEAAQRKRNLTKGLKSGGPTKCAKGGPAFLSRPDMAEKSGKQGMSRPDKLDSKKKSKNKKRKFF